MSVAIVRPRKRKLHVEYSLEFDFDNSGGYSFPCTSIGRVLVDEMTDCAIENLKWCYANLDKFCRKPHVSKSEWSYTEPALAKCVCSQEFELADEYEGACQCPKCGRWYNLFGQELIDPEYWEEDEEEM